MNRKRAPQAIDHLNKSRVPIDRYRKQTGTHQSRIEERKARRQPNKLQREDLLEGSQLMKVLALFSVLCSLMVGLYVFFNNPD